MNLVSPPEASYITASLQGGRRADGRSLLEYREIFLSTSVISQSSGSARVSCAGTDVLVGIKLESVDVASTSGSGDDERVTVSLELSQSAQQAILPYDPTSSLLAHAYSLLSPLYALPQLCIIPNSRYWSLVVDISVLALTREGAGNMYDVLGVGVVSALWDLKIPRTREVQYLRPGASSSKRAGEGDIDMDGGASDGKGGINALLKGKKGKESATGGKGAAGSGAPDFELLDYEADTGEPLKGREGMPMTITLNLTPKIYHPFLDASLFESFCSPLRVVFAFSLPTVGTPSTSNELLVRGIRQEIPDGSTCPAPNELPYDRLDGLIDTAQDIAKSLIQTIHAKLRDPETSRGGVRLGAYP